MSEDGPFGLRVESQNGVTSVALRGALDMATVPILDDLLSRFEEERDGQGHPDGGVLLDLRELTFMDSSGLHALLRAKKRSEENGSQTVVIGASQTIRRLMHVTGTEFLLDDEGTVRTLGRLVGDGKARTTRERGTEDV